MSWGARCCSKPLEWVVLSMLHRWAPWLVPAVVLSRLWGEPVQLLAQGRLLSSAHCMNWPEVKGQSLCSGETGQRCWEGALPSLPGMKCYTWPVTAVAARWTCRLRHAKASICKRKRSAFALCTVKTWISKLCCICCCWWQEEAQTWSWVIVCAKV